MKNKPTTFAFVDASNMIYRNTDKNPWKIDLKKLIKYLKERFGASQIFYYAGIDNNNDPQKKLYQRMAAWGYKLRLNKVKNFINTRGEWYQKADVDSRMTFEIMKYFSDYNQAVVITGDGDFYWVFEYLLKNKEKVWLISSPKKTAKELKELFGHRFSSLDDTRKWLEYVNSNKKEADPTNVSASGITKRYYHKTGGLSTRRSKSKNKKHV